MKKVLFLLCLVVASTYAASEDEATDGLFARVENLFKYLKSEDLPLDENELEADRMDLNASLTYLRADGSEADCNCNPDGSEDLTCDAESGKCHCKCDVEGDKCDTCTAGHHSFPDCHECQCNEEGSSSFICDKASGQCECKSNLITGLKCDKSQDEYYDFPDPKPCECNTEGSEALTCDDGSGKCSCKDNVVGDKCTQCAAEHYGFPTCDACMCNADGSVDNSCDDNGKCSCNDHVEGEKCDKCVGKEKRCTDFRIRIVHQLDLFQMDTLSSPLVTNALLITMAFPSAKVRFFGNLDQFRD